MRLKTSVDYDPVPTDGFVLIPAGGFQMGDQSSPLVGSPSELPVHTVQVSAFFMAKYEVTKELWDSVRSWGLANGYTDLAVGNGTYASKGANHPVHSITWYDMVKWCNARSEMEGLTPCYAVSGATYKTGQSEPVCNWSANGFRLPTEAEWEKAARGGAVGQNFPWGNTISHSNANFTNSGGESYQAGTTGPHPTYGTGDTPYSSPVGSFAANGYGLYDMAGNMGERCWDWCTGGHSLYLDSRCPRHSVCGKPFASSRWAHDSPEFGVFENKSQSLADCSCKGGGNLCNRACPKPAMTAVGTPWLPKSLLPTCPSRGGVLFGGISPFQLSVFSFSAFPLPSFPRNPFAHLGRT